MPYEPNQHHRRSIRLEGYDYARVGAYFVTICVERVGAFGHPPLLFGDVVNGVMRLNQFGMIVESEWLATPKIRPQIELDEYAIMPNHFHGILIIVRDVRPIHDDPPGSPFRSPSQTVGAIIRGFKSVVTSRINSLRNRPGAPVWQNNYYERIIRNRDEMNLIRQYIKDNPAQWERDRENLAFPSEGIHSAPMIDGEQLP